MNKATLIEVVAAKTQLGKKEAENAVECVFGEIIETLKKGEEVAIVGFGSFIPAKRKAKPGRNPATGEPMEIPPRVVPKFKAGKTLKEALASLSST